MFFLDKKRLIQNIDAIAASDFSKNKGFGAAYYVYQKGNLALEKCYGVRTLQGAEPITNTTVFRLASMTKPITAIATLILAERGLLSPEDPIAKYLPEFSDIHIIGADGKDLGRPENPPTIRQILSHCSGIGSDGDKLAAMGPQDKETLDGCIAFMRRSGLDFEPASAQKYSGVGAFDVLTKIIELVSGMDYLQFLQKEIFIPCGMEDTTFLPNAEQQERMVAMHTRAEGRNAAYEMPQGCIFEDYPAAHYLGGAGLVSTLRDYCKFCEMLLNQGETKSGALLSAEWFAQLHAPQVWKRETESWGLGVRVVTARQESGIPANCFGWSGAYGAHFWIDPKNKIFAVFMKNSKVDGGSGNESAKAFEAAVYGALDQEKSR